MSFIKRTRILSLRVTQDEYQALEAMSRRHKANSVSEFLRQLIMNPEPVVWANSGRTHEFSDEITELKRKVDQLSQMVAQSLALQRSASVDEKEPQIEIVAAQIGD